MRRPSDLLRGRVAVITGAADGLGLHIATAMAQAGAQIVVAAVSMPAIEAIYDRFTQIPGVQALGWAADMRRYEEVVALADQAVARFGRIDIWVNTAVLHGAPASTADMPPERWREIVEIDLIGAYHGTYVALRHMLPRNRGKIINVLSEEERGARRPLHSAVGTSTAGVLRLSQIVAEEYRHSGISILALSPRVASAGTGQPGQSLDSSASTLQEAAALAVRMASQETDGVTGKLYGSEPGGLAALWRSFRRR